MKLKQRLIITVLVTSLLVPLSIFGTNTKQSNLQNVEANGTPYLVQEWNFTTSSFVSGSPTVFDLDNDGLLETIFGTGSSGAYCLDDQGNTTWHYDYSQVFRGSPIIIDSEGDFQPNVVFGAGSSLRFINGTTGSNLDSTTLGFLVGSTAIVDFEDDGQWEIIAACSSGIGGIYCVNSDGSKRWTYTNISDNLLNGPAVADLDKDGVYEIIFSSRDDSVYCINETGDFQWSFNTGANVWVVPALADVDNNGDLEIIVSSATNMVYCLEHNGTIKHSYDAKDGVLNSASIADIDKNGDLEIFIPTNNGTLICLDHQLNYVWHYNPGGGVYLHEQVAIADFDGDGDLDIVAIFNNGAFTQTTVRVISRFGNQLYNYAYTVDYYSTGAPVVADIDNDGLMEIIISCGNIGDSSGSVFCFTSQNANSLLLGEQWYTEGGSMFRTNTIDSDRDFVDDLTEGIIGSNPTNNDSDADLITDGYELFYFHCDPTSNDTDSDLLTDYEELIPGVDGYITHPNDPDIDGDGLLDGEEEVYSTNPHEADSDGDSLNDLEEVTPGTDGYNTDPNNPDSDGDGANDGVEASYGTNPNLADTDSDGFSDGEEIAEGTDPLDENDYPTTDSPSPSPSNTPTGGGGLPLGIAILIGSTTLVAALLIRKRRR